MLSEQQTFRGRLFDVEKQGEEVIGKQRNERARSTLCSNCRETGEACGAQQGGGSRGARMAACIAQGSSSAMGSMHACVLIGFDFD